MHITVKVSEIVVVEQGRDGNGKAEQPHEDHGYDSCFEGHASKTEGENDANQAVNCDDCQGEDWYFAGYGGNYAGKDT